MDGRTRMGLELFRAGAIKFGAFRLKLHDVMPDAPLSPIYIDLRLIRSYPEIMDLAIDAYIDIARGLVFDVVADVPTASTPLVAVMANRLRVPMVSPRLDQKTHGLSKRIDGAWRDKQIALVVDDLVTLADSKLDAIQVMQSAGLVVHDVLVLIDRGQGGSEALKQRGINLHSVYRLNELLNLYLHEGLVDQPTFEKTMDYLEAGNDG